MENDFFYLGIITKPFGIKGHLVVFLDTDEPEKYQHLEVVFLSLDGEMLPYFIEECQWKGTNNLILKFQDVDEAESKRLIKTELYLPISDLPPLTGNKFYYHEVISFQVVDKEKGYIGICQDFIDISRQPIMQVDHNGTEILIPAIDDIFTEIDREKKIIFINAPEGLIDIYLSEKGTSD